MRSTRSWVRTVAAGVLVLLATGGCKVLRNREYVVTSGGIVYGQKTSGLLFYWYSSCKRDHGCLYGLLNDPSLWQGDSGGGLEALKLGARPGNEAAGFYSNGLDRIGTANPTRCLAFVASSIGAGFTTVPNGGSCQPLQNPADEGNLPPTT